MKDFAMQLTQKCVSMGLLDESYSEWFAYSIEKRVTTLFTWLVQCLIGGFCFGWTLTISFSVFFLLIRKYTNGYHAATYSKCLFCSILLEVVLLASISYVFRTGLALLFLTIVSDITILYIAQEKRTKNGVCFTIQNILSKNEKTNEKNGFCCLQSFASVIQ